MIMIFGTINKGKSAESRCPGRETIFTRLNYHYQYGHRPTDSSNHSHNPQDHDND